MATHEIVGDLLGSFTDAQRVLEMTHKVLLQREHVAALVGGEQRPELRLRERRRRDATVRQLTIGDDTPRSLCARSGGECGALAACLAPCQTRLAPILD